MVFPARTHPADLFEAVVVGSVVLLSRLPAAETEFQTLRVSVNAACGPAEFGPAPLGNQQLFNPTFLEDGAELETIVPQTMIQV